MTHYTKPTDEASRKFADRMGDLPAPKEEGKRVR